jgi:preprotein translocase subunit SecG
MTTVLLILHLFVTLTLIGVVLIQRSEGGGLGIGTSQGMGSFMSGRGTANLLTRMTAVLAAIFFALSLALALLNRGTSGVGRPIFDAPPAQSTGSPSGLPGAAAPNAATAPVLPGAGETTAPAAVAPLLPPPATPPATTGAAPGGADSGVPAPPRPSVPTN